MKIFSSLNPSASTVEVQRRALASWRSAGFSPVVVNSAADRLRWQDSFADLAEYHAVEPGRTFQGRWVPLVEILKVGLSHPGQDPLLILNSDIRLLESDGLRVALGKHPQAVVMLRRVEISSNGLTQERANPWGWDGCWIPRHQAVLFQDSSFCLGLPCWDYWIPYKAIHIGLEVVLLEGKYALHEIHAEQWTEEIQARLTRQIARDTGISTLKRWWLRFFGPKEERKLYGYHNHFSGHVRDTIQAKARVVMLNG